MSTVDVDSRGRVYIPKEMREEFDGTFRIVKLESGIKLVPVDEEPVGGLREATDRAEDVDIKDIGKEVDEAVKTEVEEEFG